MPTRSASNGSPARIQLSEIREHGARILHRVGDDHIDHVPCRPGGPPRQVRGAGQVFWGIPARPIKQYLRELALLRRRLER